MKQNDAAPAARPELRLNEENMKLLPNPRKFDRLFSFDSVKFMVVCGQ